MPTAGVNVLQNPDFSEGDLYWIWSRTWDPLLAWGVQGQTTSLVEQAPPQLVAPGVMQLDFGTSTQLDPSTKGYGGLLYSGGGFDSEPGDTWRIQFTAYRRRFQAPYHGVLIDSLGQGNDLFIRFGCCVEQDGEWISYYKNLPALTQDNEDGLFAYDETFEVPSNWPGGVLQFAICHTGSYELPPQNVFQDYVWGFRIDLSDPSLEFVSNGSGSPGPAGVPNPYVSWPTPRWAPGSPMSVDVIGGGGCCCGVVEWDPFEFRDPMTSDRAVIGNVDHVAYRTFLTTGTAGTWLLAANEVAGIPAHIELRAGTCSQCYIADDDGNPATPVPTGEFGGGTYDSTQTGWDARCGDWCMNLMTYYCAVEGRETLFFTISHIEEWFSIAAFVPAITHPSTAQYPFNNGIIFGVLEPEFLDCGEEFNGPEGQPGGPIPPTDLAVVFCTHMDCSTPPEPPGPPPGEPGQALYLTHEVAPGDLHVGAGGSGGLNLRGARAAPGDAHAGATGPAGLDLGHIKGQP